AYPVFDYVTYVLTIAGEVEAAAKAYERALAFARSRGDRLSANDLLVLRANLHLQRGDLQLAEADLSAVEGEPLTIVMSTYACGFLAELFAEAGRPAEAAAAIERAPGEGVPLGHRLLFMNGRAHAHLAAGAVEQALADYSELGDRMESLGVRNPAFAPWRSQAALALHRLGRRPEARRLAQE